jgi:predicted metal-binding membrane protein
MAHQLQHKNSAGYGKAALPVEFMAVCILTFAAGVLATAYFCRSMCGDMEMPGGWMMSMMWMRMDGQTWFMSGTSFLAMWLAMMVAMMLPSALPMFLRTRRQWTSLCYMMSGYFAIWLAAGVGIYVLGVAFMTAAMRSELLSRVVPLLSGISLIVVGAIQFTRWKMRYLLCCRSTIACSQHEASFRLGCKQGAACCLCCAAPMAVQLILGIMDPLVMIAVAIVIAAEKLLPRPEITARLAGITAIAAGITMSIRYDWPSVF